MATEYFNDAWRIPNNKNQSLVSNYSMEFDGSGNDSITIPSYTIPENSTVSFWVKSSLTNPQDIIISGVSGHYYPYLLLSGGNIRLIIKAGSISNEIISDVAWVADTWFHIAITGENGQGAGSTATYYINGVSKGTSLHRAPTLTVIGDYTTASLAWNGQIDQVCFFDYALPATGTNSIATLYGGGTAVTNPMSLSPKPIYYAQLGDQSVDNGANYLVPNNSLQDYVFETSPAGSKYFTIPSITISEEATISIWFNIKTLGSVQQVTFATTSDKLTFRLSTNLQIIYADSSGFVSLITDIPPTNFLNKWHHLALVQDANGGNVYIDNVNKGVIGSKTPTFGNIGGRNVGGQELNGFVSNAAIFSTNLPVTGTESVASLYNNGTPPDLSSYSNLERWYKLNAQDTFDGTNWTIKDYSNNQDGTSVRMTSANLVQSNLQHTSGYSPYALSLDGTNDVLSLSEIDSTGTKTYSCWINPTVSGNNGGFLTLANIDTDFVSIALWESEIQVMVAKTPTANNRKNTVQTISTNQWYHIVVVKSTGSVDNIYINGVNQTLGTGGGWNAGNIPAQYKIGSASFPSTPFSFSGSISNVATWNVALSSTEVTEIYNQGVPSNLNNFSGTAPVAWWQIGSNSSFNTNWTCLDEIGTNNAVSAGSMTNDDITNGVGYSANGLGTSSIDIVGDAPYSTANGISENMDVLDRTTDVPS